MANLLFTVLFIFTNMIVKNDRGWLHLEYQYLQLDVEPKFHQCYNYYNYYFHLFILFKCSRNYHNIKIHNESAILNPAPNM